MAQKHTTAKQVALLQLQPQVVHGRGGGYRVLAKRFGAMEVV